MADGLASPLAQTAALVGAVPEESGVRFRVWAPCRGGVAVRLEDGARVIELEPEENGFFSALAPDIRAGALYRLLLDGRDLFPDPASRFQPNGPHGPSEVIDAARYPWSDHGWTGPNREKAVLYELHVGTFTKCGTWQAAEERLEYLADLGITIVEVMPVTEFPGRFGWGYDGVCWFAPSHLYGRPDDFRRFVDAAHRHGIAVILDVVYNHFGPDGNYLKKFDPCFFTDRYQTDWGEAIRFDGENCDGARQFVLANVRHWITEYHLDGLRLDATQNIYDASPSHIIAAISETAREAAGDRSVYLVGENEPQDSSLARPVAQGGMGLDALWNDDFHHSAMVAATGRCEAYYHDYRGAAAEFVAAAKYGYLYQGQWYSWQKKPRGQPGLDLPAHSFVHFTQNHDQVANSARGLRWHRLTSPGRHRALTALLLLGPQTPMLFQGQEFAASTPFYYFADHEPELARLVHQGRIEFLSQFPSIAAPETREQIIDPASERAFSHCQLDFDEVRSHGEVFALYRDLLALRREDPLIHGAGRSRFDGAILGGSAFLLRYFGESGDDRLLLVNLGTDLPLVPAPEPLLAAPADCEWRLVWSSEAIPYGGGGTPCLTTKEGHWLLPGESAYLLSAQALVAPVEWPAEEEGP